MSARKAPTRTASVRAFTLMETIAIVVVLGIVAALIAPQFAGATDDSRTSNGEVIIGGVRTAITAYRTRAENRGGAPFPSLPELMTPGVVVMDQLPSNPFTGVRGVQAVNRTQAESRAVFNTGSVGWNYFFDNSGEQPVVYFYANCSTPTTIPNGRGGVLTANEL